MKRSQTTLTSFFTKKSKDNTDVEEGHSCLNQTKDKQKSLVSTSRFGSQEIEANSKISRSPNEEPSQPKLNVST